MKKTDFLKPLLFFLVLGTLLFNLLMSWSLSVHDYYSLDTWFPIIVVLITYLIFNSDFSKEKLILPIITILFIAGALSIATEMQHWKYKYYSTSNDIVMNDFRESLVLLSQVKPEDKVLIIAQNGWNAPMIYWQRNAYRVADKYKKNIPKLINQKFDFIITQDREFDNIILKEYPNFKQELTRVDGNGKLTIWKQINNKTLTHEINTTMVR